MLLLPGGVGRPCPAATSLALLEFTGSLMGFQRPGTCCLFCSNKRRVLWGMHGARGGWRVGGSGSWPLWGTHSWLLTHRETSSCLLSTFGPCSCGRIPPPGPPFSVPTPTPQQPELQLMPRTHPGLWRLRLLRAQRWSPSCGQGRGGGQPSHIGDL